MASSRTLGGRFETTGDLIIASLEDLKNQDFKRFKDKLSDFSYEDHPSVSRGYLENADWVTTKNLLIDVYGDKAALDVTVQVLKSIGLMGPAEKLHSKFGEHGGVCGSSLENRLEGCRKKYMMLIKERYQCHKDGNACLGETVLLEKRYTKLLLIKKQRNMKEREHEITCLGQRHLQIMEERASTEYAPITIDCLFDPDENGITPKVVVLLGPAGVGKTMTSQKVMLDWASGNLYQDSFHVAFYMSCRELNTINDDTSLAGLICKICHVSCERDLLKSILSDFQKLLFIIDGFDELRWTSLGDTEVCEDPFQEANKEIILNSIFRKLSLWGASVIITTRPYSLEQMNDLFKCPRYVEILGFTGIDREQFFYNFFTRKDEAEMAFSVVKDNDTLFTMCAVPITCWIVCTVIKQQMVERQREMDCKTTTSIYLLYLKSLIKFHGRNSNQSIMNCLKKVCALANEGIWNQKILFEESDLRRHGLSITEIDSMFLNENIFQRDVETHTCYNFIHLSVQEFLAALFYVLRSTATFTSLILSKRQDMKKILEEVKKKSHLELMVQFLFGLSSEKQLKETVNTLGCSNCFYKDSLVLKDWLEANLTFIQKLKYLYELQDEDLIVRVMSNFQKITVVNSRPDFDYRALSYCLKNSRTQHKVLFINCRIGPKTRAVLASALPKCSHVGFNNCIFLEKDDQEIMEGVKSSLSGLFNSQRGIQELGFHECYLNASCCDQLHIIVANQSLVKLNLSLNYLQELGIKALCKGLKQKECVLQELRLRQCGLTSFCCADLRSLMMTNRSLTVLDLSKNKLEDYGIKLLCEGLSHPGSTLKDLNLEDCGIPSACCEILSDIVASSSLIVLDLSSNNLQDSGLKLLCEGLKHPRCVLQELRLKNCSLTSASCIDLGAVIISSRSLRELRLTENRLLDSGMKHLCEAIRHPGCVLQDLRLRNCGLTSSCCEDLRSVVSRSLTKLILRANHLKDSGIKLLCEGLRVPGCTLKYLSLEMCVLTTSSCDALHSVIVTNRSLTTLELSWNHLKNSGIKRLSEGLRHPGCTLQELWFKINDSSNL
ncbi:NACHT, LRR and PYD domains-containing protein 3-like isoform X2 [Hyperolius riggenbachi]|uniref:NACHT, LRR and PYD domains-containing protein 3-like isoform X2 n=1 Tax=Hyperolius riggenbachi TaxID=752182 RepID=UPI0035A3C500